MKKNGNHNDVLYNAFKKWVDHGCCRNVSFKYYSRMFMFYGLVLEMFDISNAYVLGKAREACFIMQLPIYTHLNFTNYFRDIYSRNKFHGEVASGILYTSTEKLCSESVWK